MGSGGEEDAVARPSSPHSKVTGVVRLQQALSTVAHVIHIVCYEV